MRCADVPSIPRQVNAIHHIPMGRNRSPLPALWSAHIPRSGMVHRYVSALSLSTYHSFRIVLCSDAFVVICTLLTTIAVAYSLGIYLLNLFLAFLSPKFDPALEQDEGMEDGNASGLPTKEDQEFRPFVRRLPEFKFWYSTTKAISIGFFCSWFEIFNLPVFWPVLVVYWLILFGLTSKLYLPTSTSRRLTNTVRRQIQHMIKYRYVPFTVGKARYSGASN